MTEHIKPHTTLITIENIANDDAERKLIEIVKQIPGHQQFDLQHRKVLKIWGDEPLALDSLIQELNKSGFVIGSITNQEPSKSNDLHLRVSGMTCHSCEVLIERSWKKVNGVETVSVSTRTGKALIKTDGSKITLHDLQSAIGGNKYKIRWDNNDSTSESLIDASKKPSTGQLVVMFILAIVLVNLFSKLGLLQSGFSVGASLGIGAALVIGLIASASSCLAINAGLLLSSSATFNERYPSATRIGRMRPVFLFVSGRIASYGLLGAALGIIGKSLTPSPLITALIVILAALYMLVMGMEMLHIAPSWLKRIMPGMSKSLSHKILDAQEKKNPLMPFVLGGATFFLPCGFTQALQLYALTTGSGIQSGLILMTFAIGTAPALLALGYAGNAFKGSVGRVFHQFAGALVIIMGLVNIQNGLTIAGYPLNLPTITPSTVAQTKTSKTTAVSPVPTNKDGVQVVKMVVNGGYTPDNFTIKVGVPVRWEVDGTDALGCDQFLMSRELEIQEVLKTGINVFDFTPEKAGTIQFSCSMGMYRGSFTVVD